MRKGWLRRPRRPPRPRSMESAWALAKGAGGGGLGDAGLGGRPAHQHVPGEGTPLGDSVPSGAVSTGTAASVASDPVLLYISSRMAALHRLASTPSAAAAEAGSSGGSITTAGSRGAPLTSGSSCSHVAGSGLSVDVQQWEVGAQGRATLRVRPHITRSGATGSTTPLLLDHAAAAAARACGAHPCQRAWRSFAVRLACPVVPAPLRRLLCRCSGRTYGWSGSSARAAMQGRVVPAGSGRVA